MEDEEKVESLTLAIIALSAIPVMVCANGYVAMKLYAWHVQPLFAGMPILGFAEMVGVMAFYAVFRVGPQDKREKQTAEAAAQWVITRLALLSLLLFIGWLAA